MSRLRLTIKGEEGKEERNPRQGDSQVHNKDQEPGLERNAVCQSAARLEDMALAGRPDAQLTSTRRQETFSDCREKSSIRLRRILPCRKGDTEGRNTVVRSNQDWILRYVEHWQCCAPLDQSNSEEVGASRCFSRIILHHSSVRPAEDLSVIFRSNE